jgi:hypothetical protein
VDVNSAGGEEGVELALEFGRLVVGGVNGESRVLVEGLLLGDGETYHVFLDAVNLQIIGVTTVMNHIDFIEVFISFE